MDELGSDLNSLVQQAGRVRKAPEHFLDAEGIRRVGEEARSCRRGFMRQAFAAAAASAVVPAAMARGNPVPPEGGDPHILNLPEHATGLGQGVATDGYGKPSRYESNIQRLIDEGCNSIAVVGFTQTGAAVAATKANPEIAFALIDGSWNSLGDDYTEGTAAR